MTNSRFHSSGSSPFSFCIKREIETDARSPKTHREKRVKVEPVMKVKEEDEEGGESAFVPIVSCEEAFGNAGGGSDYESDVGDDESDVGDDESDVGDHESDVGGHESDNGDVDDAYCGCRYSRNPFFNIFLNASQNETQYTAPAKVVPIASLYPGYYGNWAVRGRVVHKIEVRSYDNRNGTGTFFWFVMKDDAGGEVRVVCFTREVAMFYKKVVEGMELVLSRGRLQRPKDRFNPEGRRCEIVLQYNSTIQAIPGTDSSNSPQGKANATSQASEAKARVTGLQSNATPKASEAKARVTGLQSNATPKASEAKAPVTEMLSNATPKEEVKRKKRPVENPVQDETLAVKAQNELLLKKVVALEKNYKVVSSQALESSTQLQDCKARLEELETWVKEGKVKTQAS